MHNASMYILHAYLPVAAWLERILFFHYTSVSVAADACYISMQMQCTEMAKQRDAEYVKTLSFDPAPRCGQQILPTWGRRAPGFVASTFPQESGRVDALLGACCIATLARRKARSTGRSGSVQCARARARPGRAVPSAVQKMETDS